MGELFHELVVASRQWRDARGAIASVTLAIGLSVGANLAIFSQLYSLLAPASPYAHDERLLVVENTGGYSTEDAKADLPYMRQLSWPDFEEVQERQQTFAGLGAATSNYVAVLSGGDRPRAVCRLFVSRHLLEVLGVVPTLGRSFGPEDFATNAAGTVLLTEGIWRRYFASDPSVVGRSVQLDDQPFSVAGVLPSKAADMLTPRTELFALTQSDPCVITPLAHAAAGEAEEVLEYLASEKGRDDPSLLVVGRLRPGGALSQANAELAVMAARLAGRRPNRPGHFGLRAVPFRAWQTRAIRGLLLMLTATAALTLLVACANTAGLLMADSMRRAPEFATRIALGATPGHLIRVVVARSILWSLPGGLAGLLLASVALGLSRWAGAPTHEEIEFSYLRWWLVTISAVLTLGVATVSAGAAAWGLRGGALMQSIRDGGQSGAGRRGRRAAMILLTVQISAAVALAFGAGLLLRSIWIVTTAEYGFDLQHGFVVEVRLPRARYQDSTEQMEFYQRALSRVRRVPGVAAAGFSSSPPLTGAVSTLSGGLRLVTATEARKVERLNAQFVTGEYFDALGMKLLRGRSFSQEDELAGGNTVVVDEAFCRRFTGGGDAVGAVLWFGQDPLTIVGVVADARQSVDANGMPAAPDAGGTVYLSPAKVRMPPTWRFLVVRTFPQANDVAATVAGELLAVEAAAVVGDPKSFSGLLSTKTAGQRRLSLLVTVMGGIVLLLATASLTSALSQLVTLRCREIAIRYALGAAHVHIVGLTLKHLGATLATGLVVGIGAGLLFGRALATQLYGVSATDPWTLTALGGVLATLGILAAAGPLRRAFRIDLPTALRRT